MERVEVLVEWVTNGKRVTKHEAVGDGGGDEQKMQQGAAFADGRVEEVERGGEGATTLRGERGDVVGDADDERVGEGGRREQGGVAVERGRAVGEEPARDGGVRGRETKRGAQLRRGVLQEEMVGLRHGGEGGRGHCGRGAGAGEAAER